MLPSSLGVMSVLAPLLGALLVVVALYDLVSTTVAVSGGGGALTRRVSSGVWAIALWLHTRFGRRRRLLQASGPVTLFTVLLTWTTLLVVGWALILDPAALGVSASTAGDISFADRLHLSATTIIGRGDSTIDASSSVWRALVVAAGTTGVVVVSLSIAYVLPVVNAIVNGRQTAAYISALGHTPEHIVERAWNGQDFGDLDLHLIALTPMIVDQAERHMAYPVLFYFHSIERHSALGASIVVLDEAITMVDCCHEGRVQDTALVPARIALTEFLDTLRRAYISPADRTLPKPYLANLRDAGLPFVEDDEVDEAYADIEARRRLLHALVEHDGWTWDEIGRGTEAHENLTAIDPIGLRTQQDDD